MVGLTVSNLSPIALRCARFASNAADASAIVALASTRSSPQLRRSSRASRKCRNVRLVLLSANSPAASSSSPSRFRSRGSGGREGIRLLGYQYPPHMVAKQVHARWREWGYHGKRESEVPAGNGYLSRDSARADLTFLTCSTKVSTLRYFSSSVKPISSICSSRRRAIVLSPSLRVVRRFDSGGGTGSADMVRAFLLAMGDTLVYLTTQL
jgi:hypothetical protein